MITDDLLEKRRSARFWKGGKPVRAWRGKRLEQRSLTKSARIASRCCALFLHCVSLRTPGAFLGCVIRGALSLPIAREKGRMTMATCLLSSVKSCEGGHGLCHHLLEKSGSALLVLRGKGV